MAVSYKIIESINISEAEPFYNHPIVARKITFKYGLSFVKLHR